MHRTLSGLILIFLVISAAHAGSIQPSRAQMLDRDTLLFKLLKVQEGIDWELKYAVSNFSADESLLSRHSISIEDTLTGDEPADVVRPWDIVEFKDLVLALADLDQPLLIYWNSPGTHLVVTTAAEKKGDGRYWLLSPEANYAVDSYSEISGGQFTRVAKVYGNHEIRHRLQGMPALIVETRYIGGLKIGMRICNVQQADAAPNHP